MQMVNNYGSLLQAYGLKKIIESFDNDVEFINIIRNEDDYKLLESINKGNKKGFNYSYIHRTFEASFFSSIVKRILYKFFIMKCFFFRCKYLNITKKSKQYDLCVIGSDEVFNCMNAGWWGFTSQLFGNIENTKRIITYAASCGETTYDDLPLSIKNSINSSFNNIASFSARDKNTKRFIEKFGINNVIENFDPVLVYNFDSEIKNAKLHNVPKHYCVIYSYSNRFDKCNEIKEILLFCKKNKLIPISVQGIQDWCDKYYFGNPFQCLKLIQEADFVITDTFHGTIFSAKYTKKFSIIIRNSNNNKLSDLVNKLQIQEHLAHEISDINKIYKIDKNEKEINNIIENERIKALDYLQNSINGSK